MEARRQKEATLSSVDNTGAAESEDAPGGTGQNAGGGEQVSYGGGFQPGGGMVEPDEFATGTEDEGLPNDALAEGLSSSGGRSAAEVVESGTTDTAALDSGATVDPATAPDDNDTGDRVGDVAGYLGSDQVVGVDPSAEDPQQPTDR